MDATAVKGAVSRFTARSGGTENSAPVKKSWAELKHANLCMGDEARLETVNGKECIVLPLAEEILSKSGKTYMRYSTGGRFHVLANGSMIQAIYLSKWNPIYQESKSKLVQATLAQTPVQ